MCSRRRHVQCCTEVRGELTSVQSSTSLAVPFTLLLSLQPPSAAAHSDRTPRRLLLGETYGHRISCDGKRVDEPASSHGRKIAAPVERVYCPIAAAQPT